MLLFVDEILIIENIRRRPYELKAHAGVALVAYGKKVFPVHHRLMRDAVSAVMDNFIDASLWHRLAGKEYPGMSCGASTMAGFTAPVP
jgi:hypothetical protein